MRITRKFNTDTRRYDYGYQDESGCWHPVEPVQPVHVERGQKVAFEDAEVTRQFGSGLFQFGVARLEDDGKWLVVSMDNSSKSAMCEAQRQATCGELGSGPEVWGWFCAPEIVNGGGLEN